MKKVIDGSLYNTQTARLIGDCDNGRYGRDLYACAESLYRTKSGKYFLHGEGGAGSKYSRSCGSNEWCGGEMIIPMSEVAAREWAEEHLCGDDYLKAFSATDEDLHTVAVSDQCYARLKALKDLTGKTFAQLVEVAVNQYNA